MEIGIGIQSVNSISKGNKGAALTKKEMVGFSQHLLGSVSNQVSGNEVKKEGSLSFLTGLEALLGTHELEGLALTQKQLDELSKVKEVDISQIADILGVSTEAITTLFSELSSVLFGTMHEAATGSGEDAYENLLGTLQLLQSVFSQNVKGSKPLVQHALEVLNNEGQIEKVIKLAKVLELFTQKRDLHVTDAAKATEMKAMVKNLQTGVEASITKLGHPVGDWSRILRESYTRNLPEETHGKDPAIDVPNADKKSISSIPGTNLHFVLPRTETNSIHLTSGGRSVQYDQFVKEFQNILGKSSLISQPNMSKMLIKLYPEHLGSLRIELLQHNGVMTAKILASSTSAKEMLDSQIHGLKHAFTAQNLNVEKIEISHALSDTERQFKEQSQQQSQHQKQQQSDQTGKTKEEENQSFKDYLVNTEI
ncbi:flagellar hook-length control protein FliK [Rossellomorea aquimaris]|uniref:flagellar hook-length control protein FliK n=1 Tax=Rossellomorea aquimaris TaxID=189382 RepID=UPI001CD65B6A|nr:flagellar hook-length control protein FliK [Rossellomorea aquimaris]MCA1059164.1 flagellar hook-length control protein FliK [Rossellomorea aquimaris]